MSRASHQTANGSSCRSGPQSPEDCIGRSPGRYLVAIHRLREGRHSRVSTAEISGALGVEAPSTTEMVEKLADHSLVVHEHYRGATVTRRGELIAEELRWRQATVRAFFVARLDLMLDSETAYRIGYLLPSDAVERLDRMAET